jgi:TonB family protein
MKRSSWLLLALVGLALTLGLPAQDQKPVARVMAQPQYPFEYARAGVGGRVMVEFVISPTGKTKDIKIIRSTDRGFELPAIRAVSKWQFQPGMKDGRVVDVKVSQIIDFDMAETAIYPRAPLMRGLEGSATIGYLVDNRGRAIHVQVLEAGHPDFAGAAKAAVMASAHAPAFANTRGQMEPRQRTFRFLINGKGDARVEDTTRKLLAQLEKNPEVASFSELDKPPVATTKTLANVAPDLMANLVVGNVVVEIYVDTAGNVLLPQVISATDPDLGYAAAHALAGWKYEPPKRGGKRVVARGTIALPFMK